MDKPEKPKASHIPWNPVWAVVYVILAFFVTQILSGLAISIYPLLRNWNSEQSQDWLANSVVGQFSFVLIAETLAILAVYLFLRHYKRTFAVIGLVRPRLRDGGIGLLAFPIYFVIFAILVTLATQLIPSFNANQAQEIGFNNVAGTGPLILTFISLVILPPITEEILIRGFLFGSLRKYFKFGVATVITSLVFAAAHLPEGGAAGPLYIAALDTFILSVVLCYLRERTGSLWAGITLHALKNGVAFVSLFILHVR